MPRVYLHDLTATPRTTTTNLHLGVLLALNAGALNAGGFLAVDQYTSHMTGAVSTLADQLVLGNMSLAVIALASWLAFATGAGVTAILVNYGYRRDYGNVFALPLLLEAVLILVFGLVGAYLEKHELAHVSGAVVLLCLTMGLQNALITKASRAEIRTTHVTGLTTDLGIELGKLFYWNRTSPNGQHPAVLANREKLRVHATLIAAFFIGGLLGAIGFKQMGFGASIPLALALAIIALSNRAFSIRLVR